LQLLQAHIPKAQKIHSSHQSFFALLGSGRAKAACKTLVKSTPEHLFTVMSIQLHQHFTNSFLE